MPLGPISCCKITSPPKKSTYPRKVLLPSAASTHVRESSFYRIQNIRCFGEPRRWGTLEGTPGPGRTAQSLEGTFREPAGGEGRREEVEEKKRRKKKKKRKKREGRSIIVPPRGLRVCRFCLAQRSLYLGNLQPGREPAPAGAVFEVFGAFSDMMGCPQSAADASVA